LETLADRIARDGALNELDAVGWMIRLAQRLEAIHELGIAHGRVSPACVITASTDRSSRGVLADLRETPDNLSFQSPERLGAGAGVSPEDDAWALAATLYFVLTGKVPFASGSDARQSNPYGGVAPLAAFDVGDDDLQRVLDGAFARERATRTRSVAVLRGELERWHPDASAQFLPPLADAGADGRESIHDVSVDLPERVPPPSDRDRMRLRIASTADFGDSMLSPPSAPSPRVAPGTPAKPSALQRALPTPGFRDPARPLGGTPPDDDADDHPTGTRRDARASGAKARDARRDEAGRPRGAPVEANASPIAGGLAALEEGVSLVNAARISGMIEAELSGRESADDLLAPDLDTLPSAPLSEAPLAAEPLAAAPAAMSPPAGLSSIAPGMSPALSKGRSTGAVVVAIAAAIALLLVAGASIYFLWLRDG
jgi:hypothetical protein